MSFISDKAAIANADSGVIARILLERRIAVSLVNELLAAGFSISIDNGEDETEPSTNVDKILDAMSLTDEDYVHVYKDAKYVGWVFLVYGNDGWDVINDGWDVINDYTTNLETHIRKTNALIEELGG